MRVLTLLRHAKSSWGEPGLDDFDRPLNERGRKAAEAVGREFKRRGASFDRVVASPALRVRQTLDHLCRGYGEALDVTFDRNVYAAPAATLLRVVHGLPDSCRSPLLVGHNPGLQQLALTLTENEQSGLRERVAEKYPMAAVAVVALQAASWRAASSGELIDLIVPRDLEQR